MYVGVPTDPPLGTPAADRPTHLPPPPPPPSSPPSRPPKVFAPGWGLELEQAAPLGCCMSPLILFSVPVCNAEQHTAGSCDPEIAVHTFTHAMNTV